ncbi:MAG: glycosyltransferase [Bradymonadaceae bacterium]
MLTETTQYPLMYVGRSSAHIAERYLPRLERLISEGFDVHVLAAADGGFDVLRRRGVHARPLPISHDLNVPGWMGALVIMQAYFIDHKPVLVHALDSPIAWPAAFAAQNAHVPAVFVTMNHHVINGDGPLTHVLTHATRSAYERLAKWSDKYLVTNEEDFSTLQALNLVEPARLEMLIGGDGIDLTAFDPEDDALLTADEARRELEIPPTWREVIGVVALDGSSAALDILMKAATDLHRSNPAAGWAVIWPREGPRVGLKRLKALQDRGFVRILDESTHRPMLYHISTLMACVGGGLNVARPLMEAAAMGLAAVALESPTTRSIIVDGQTGHLVSPGAPDEFTRALQLLLERPTIRREIAHRARARARDRFDRRAVDEQILRLYDETLSRHFNP